MNKNLKLAIILGSLSAIPPICTDLYIPAFPIIGESFNVSATQVQLSLTANLLGLACGQLFIGPLSDIHGRKKPLLFSLLIFIFASIGCAFATTISRFIALRFIQGLAGSGGVVLSRTIAYDSCKGSALTEFIALLMIINGVAPILAPVLGGQIITWFSWQFLFIFLALCGILMFIASYTGLSESLTNESRIEGSFKTIINSFTSLFCNKPYLACMGIHCFIMGGLFAYISAAPFILQLSYGLSPIQFSIIFAINGLAMMITAKIASGMIIKINERKQLKTVAFIYTCAGLSLLAMSFFAIHNLWLFSTILFILTACIGVGECNSFSLAMQFIKANAGSASGLLGIGSFLFGSLITPLVSLSGETSIFPLAFILFATGLASLFILKFIPAKIS